MRLEVLQAEARKFNLFLNLFFFFSALAV